MIKMNLKKMNIKKIVKVLENISQPNYSRSLLLVIF